ncbi:MAG: nucleotide exchange factor GrpE [Candidatus Komeilibacteria bacterium]|nr:nucleotide exchange factor GrpE [Candidatus Komeilibacteria bacterium]
MNEELENQNEVATDESMADLTKQVAELNQKCGEYLQGWQRAQADYQNLVKQTAREKIETAQYANEELIRELLPLVDYFKYAFKHLTGDFQNSEWAEGIRQIQNKLNMILGNFGVKEMDTLEQRFDPKFHEALEEVSGTNQPSGVIVDELRTGFMLHDKVIQPARVRVAK